MGAEFQQRRGGEAAERFKVQPGADSIMDLIDQIKRDEGPGPMSGGRMKPYRDTEGHLTIGYGHNLDARGITPEIAAMLLEEDIAIAVSELRRHFDWFDHLSRPRQDALINMCFNLGI